MTQKFENPTKFVYQKSASESLSLTEFGSLTDEILEITSILALMLRDGQSSSSVRKNSHKLENCLQVTGSISISLIYRLLPVKLVFIFLKLQ